MTTHMMKLRAWHYGCRRRKLKSLRRHIFQYVWQLRARFKNLQTLLQILSNNCLVYPVDLQTPESFPMSATTDESWQPFVAESDREGLITRSSFILTKQYTRTLGRWDNGNEFEVVLSPTVWNRQDTFWVLYTTCNIWS
ncbi:hypothetical protein K503DRAFT_783539 [Rhizopogon vinicolor AM-OR11-026]|uniref:Uncharacterized protein n=1 Tax=Rhizopogon vinicolor AM-OR11-026 TaxID=1314800 RepID=A0A1B7MYC7_9AGAM|nr:hypothetical protein K503DRAFT_783539 [Rhizopogon vinicolor AM-OR11-026]